jgi:hypothetical protein
VLIELSSPNPNQDLIGVLSALGAEKLA